MTDEEFYQIMVSKYHSEITYDVQYLLWHVVRGLDNNQIIDRFEHHTSVPMKYVLARELSNRMNNEEDRLELILLVGEYLL